MFAKIEGGIGPSDPGGTRLAEVGDTLVGTLLVDVRGGDTVRMPVEDDDGAVEGEVLRILGVPEAVLGREDEKGEARPNDSRGLAFLSLSTK